MLRITSKLAITGILVLSMLSAGCASNTAKGGAIGGVAGGLLGGVIGKQVGHTKGGAVIGAVVGGAAGAAIGNYMDKQAEEMKTVQGAQVERVGEGLNVTFESGILFATNSSTLQPAAQANVAKLAEVLANYPDTNVLIAGHTDSSGSDAYNQKLSEQRAEAVSSKLIASGISPSRLKTIGYGESQPIASNDTAEGKAQNRRVEIAITANETLVKAAQEGKVLK